MPYCPNCGTEFSRGDTFCVNCGMELPNPENRKRKQKSNQSKTKQRQQQSRPQSKQQKQPAQSQSVTGNQKSKKTVDRDQMLLARIVGAVSGVILFLSISLPWLEAGIAGVSTSFAGNEFILGTAVGVLGLIGAVCYLVPSVLAHAAGSISGGVTLILSWMFVNDPLAFESEAGNLERELARAVTSTEYGVFVCMICAIGLILSAAISYSATT